MSRVLPVLSLVVVLAAFGCEGAAAQEAAEDNAALRAERASTFRDVEESFSSEEEQNRWFELKRALIRDFDDICGDTFCEGDFTNLTSLRFRCSVDTRRGHLGSCLWLFAGSYETVTASTGNVRPVARFFHCKVAPVGTPVDLMNALLAPGGRGPLWQPLPGGGPSLYDVLGGCL